MTPAEELARITLIGLEFEKAYGLRDSGEKYWQQSSGYYPMWVGFQKGFEAAIKAVKGDGGPKYRPFDNTKYYQLPRGFE
jgi:hypothetical protein